ncbi:MAG: DMT family transporter [Candidatus Bathyarchaeota archaeon]|nr:DMT family transporter [Candidatus Bathyarchaeota archaeon]
MPRDRLIGLLEACLVTFLWSSSYVLVKIGLTQLTPLTLVSLRYVVASVFLVPFALSRGEAPILADRKTILKMVFLGLFGYTIAQGLQCVGLFYLPAVSVTFILNFTPVIVLILGVVFLKEYPTVLQLGGMGLVLLGAYLFFSAPLSGSSLLGVLITLISGIGWAIYLVSVRLLFVNEKLNPLGLTAFSMGLGTIALSLAAYYIEGLSDISLTSWAIIVWLGVVNTALAFFLWNHALQRLEAFEISVLQNTMLVQIAILSWIFLGEQLTVMKVIPMALVFVGALIVQLRK